MMVAAMVATLVLSACSVADDLIDAVLPPVDNEPMYLDNLNKWNVNAPTSETAIKSFGYNRCFKVVVIDDERWYSYGFPDPTLVGRQDLRFVRSLVRTGDNIHTGELICHKDIADDVVQIFKALYENKYTVQTMMSYNSTLFYDVVSDNNHPTFGYYNTPYETIDEDIANGKAIVVNVGTAMTESDEAYRLFSEKGFRLVTKSGSSTLEEDNAGTIKKVKKDYSFSAFVR